MQSMTEAEPISWAIAEKVAARVAGEETFSSSYLGASLQSDFARLTRQAEELVEKETGLTSAIGPARARVTDRREWVQANLASFRRLLGPLTDRLAPKINKSRLAPVSRALTGTQLGLVLGWTSTRVLGQYDLLLFEDDRPEDQDIVYYVGPNVLALEKRFAFPPGEFRLWLALHECTHRAQFTGVPWLTEHFRSLVNGLLADVDADPKRLNEALRRIVGDLKAGRNPVADGGLLAVFATPAQRETLNRIYGLMALLEGHGEITMSRAGAELIPSAERFHRVLHERRSSAKGTAKLMQRLLGLEAKLRQYEEGERFLKAAEAAGGRPLMDLVWQGPECLPTYEEIREPSIWVRRMQDTKVDVGSFGTNAAD